MPRFFQKCYWIWRLIWSKSFVIIVENEGLVRIQMQRPFLFEDTLQLESQFATLKNFQDQFNEAVKEYKAESDKVNKTLMQEAEEDTKPKGRKKSTE